MKVRCNCMEQFFRRTFARWGRFISSNPWPVLLIPFLISLVLSAGMFFARFETGRELLYTAVSDDAKNERATVERLFAAVTRDNDTQPLRLTREGNYGFLIATRKQPGENILMESAMLEVLDLQERIRNITVTFQDKVLKTTDLCLRWEDDCFQNQFLKYYQSGVLTLSTLQYPIATAPPEYLLEAGRSVFLGNDLGGVRTGSRGFVESADAIKLVYFLSQSNGDRNAAGLLWEREFIRTVQSSEYSFITAEVFVSTSVDDDILAASFQIICYVPIGAVILTIFTAGSSMMSDCVRSKPLLAVAGIISAVMSITSSVGLLSFLGIPLVELVGTTPFIVLGIGLDDTFVIISSWRQTDHGMAVPKRVSQTLSDAAVSITITSLTNIIAFLVGTTTRLLSVRLFCLYTGLAVAFAYVYAVTFVSACLVFSGRREAANRHCFTFRLVDTRFKPIGTCDDETGETAVAYDGGVASVETPAARYPPGSHAVMVFVRDRLAVFLLHKSVKIAVLLLYGAYLSVAVLGLPRMSHGLQMEGMVRYNSDAGRYLQLDNRYFKTFGLAVSVVITTEQNYSSSKVQDAIENLLQAFETSDQFYDSNFTLSWLRGYQEYLAALDIQTPSDKEFLDILKTQYLKIPVCRQFSLDIVFDELKESILSTRFFVVGKPLTTPDDEERFLLKAREICKDGRIETLVFNSAFIFFQEHLDVVYQTVKNITITLGTILLVSGLLIPSPVCSFWVVLSVISIQTGMMGFMSVMSIRLDDLSMISLILSVGFSVDYTIHVVHSFVVSAPPPNGSPQDAAQSRRDALSRAALYAMGMPVLQSALSTLIPLFLIVVGRSYIFVTLFRLLALAIGLGIFHGLIVMPVILSIMGPLPSKEQPTEDNVTLLSPCDDTRDEMVNSGVGGSVAQNTTSVLETSI